MEGAEKPSKIKDYRPRFSTCAQVSREFHKTKEIVLQF